MNVLVPIEADVSETRVPVVPETVEKLVKLGAKVAVAKGLGTAIRVPDEDYVSAGATVAEDSRGALREADLVLRLNKPSLDDVDALKDGAVHVSFLDPFNQPELLKKLAAKRVTAIAMELIPRTTLAQKMDALSSQANLAGYVAVVLAAERLDRIFPMMMTPAGTISPSRVFVIGAGVAGLQAIATAKRLGARVDAFDTRPAVAEQVESLGAKFVKVDLGETGETRDGYAKSLTEEQLARQREAMKKACAAADVVITTAQVFGKRAPLIVKDDMLQAMKPGSVVVDLAVETGGNVEGVQADEEADIHGVRVVGFRNLAKRAPVNASQVYSNNLGNLTAHFWDTEKKQFVVNREDEIMAGCLVTHGGEIVNEKLK